MFYTKEEFLKQNRRTAAVENDLLARTYDTIMGNVYEDHGYPWSPMRCITPGKVCFDGIWNWDSGFHAMGVSRWDTALARECLLGFMRFQCENGMFPDVIWENGNVERRLSKPPVLSWACSVVYRRDRNIDFLKEVYPRLVRSEEHWVRDRSDRGLFFYDAEDKDGKDYLLHVRYESGWDNSVRWDDGIVEKYPVDLNCFAVLGYRALSYIASELGLSDESTKWNEKEKKIGALINERLWDDEKKYYADAHRETGKISSVLTPASFMPLYCGIASNERAACMNELAVSRFLSKMPTVTFDNPAYSNDYWRGPTWLNVAYFAARGLKNYGFDTADKIRGSVLSMCDADKDGIFENYDSRTGKGLGCPHFSWSCVFINEFILNFGQEEIFSPRGALAAK